LPSPLAALVLVLALALELLEELLEELPAALLLELLLELNNELLVDGVSALAAPASACCGLEASPAGDVVDAEVESTRPLRVLRFLPSRFFPVVSFAPPGAAPKGNPGGVDVEGDVAGAEEEAEEAEEGAEGAEGAEGGIGSLGSIEEEIIAGSFRRCRPPARSPDCRHPGG